MKILKYISRIIIGIVFIFSGTVKAIDPLGVTYKFQDYFQAFNLDFLKNFSLLFAITLCTFEFIAGFSVLFNIRQKAGIWIIMLMMLVFTPLTFILALSNPVSDCGCFGDAIHLTNWQTFGKNIILIIPAIYLFINRNDTVSGKTSTREWSLISVLAILFVAFIFYNLHYLPVIDFLPYKTGTYIPDKMIIPEGKHGDMYESTFIYEKNGVQKEFTLENYPAGDTSWKFIDQKSVLVSKGYVPPIHDLAIRTMVNEDITQKILSSKGYTILMISKKLSEADREELMKGFELGNYCTENQINYYIITASGFGEIKDFRNGLTFCQADEITLKTIIRANPGYILLKEGTIIAKWSWANLPDNKSISEIINKQ